METAPDSDSIMLLSRRRARRARRGGARAPPIRRRTMHSVPEADLSVCDYYE
eukprot:COSAG01_NODE_71180_length_256_cov_1.630573_1_plen_51_part_10